jgi:hypothetical protein
MDMDKYYPYNSIGSDRLHDADDLARLMKALLTDGVAMKDAADLQVLAAGDFDVTVKAGTCVNEGRVGVNESDKTLTIAAPYAGADRIDRIVARSDFANRKSTLVYLQGEPASSPVAPDLKDDVDGHDIPLAQIAVTSGAGAVSQAMITDERELSGIIVPGNLSTLRTQMQTEFDEWFATVVATLDGDTAGNLLNLINTLDAAVVKYNEAQSRTEAEKKQARDNVGAESAAVLLWENASPTSAFAAQTISLDLSEYGAVRILAIDHTDNRNVAVDIMIPLALGTGNLCGVRPGEYPFYRSCTVDSAGCTFAGGYVGDYATPQSSNLYGVPYRIYGIK